MEKHKLLTLVNKTGRAFKNQSPTGVYREILNNTHYEALSHVLNAKDLVIYSLLVPRFNMESDIDEDYDRIEYNMFTIELVEVYNTEPMVECPECHGSRFENCEYCDGTGDEECRRCDNTGEEDCDYCDGSGVDEEGEECDMCQGAGRMTCGRCNGNGNESCNYCGGDGEVQCEYCEGEGKVESDSLSEVQINQFVCWNNQWKMFFSTIKYDEELEYSDYNNFFNNNQTLQLNYITELSEDYIDYNQGDNILINMNEKPEFKFGDKKIESI